MGNSADKGAKITKQTSEPANSKHAEQQLLKIIVFGCNTGKSKWFNGSMEHQPTIGIAFKSESFTFNDQQMNVIIYDTPENIRYFSQSLQYFSTADGVILTYDVQDMQSIQHLSDCLHDIRKTVQKTTPCLLLGMQQQTNHHLPSSKLHIDDAQQLASKYDLFHIQMNLHNEIHSKHPYIYLLRKISKLHTPRRKHNKSAKSVTLNTPSSLGSISFFSRREHDSDRLTVDSEDDFKEMPLSLPRGRTHDQGKHGHIKSMSMPHQANLDNAIGKLTKTDSKRHSLQHQDSHRNAADTVVAVDISISEEHELDLQSSFYDDDEDDDNINAATSDFTYPSQTRNRSRHSFNIPSNLKVKRKGVIKEITPGGNNAFVPKDDAVAMNHESVRSAMRAAKMTATGFSDDETHDSDNDKPHENANDDDSNHLRPNDNQKQSPKNSVDKPADLLDMKETDGSIVDANTAGMSPLNKPEGIALSAAINLNAIDDDTACRMEFARWFEESLGTSRCTKYLDKFKEKQMDDIRLVDPEIFDDDWFQSGEIEMIYVDKKLFKKEVAKYKQDCAKFEKSLDDIKMKDKYQKLLRNRGIATLWSFYHHVGSVHDVEKIVKKRKAAMIIWKKFGNDSVRQSEGNLHFKKMLTFTLQQPMDGDKETNSSDSDELYADHSAPQQMTPTPDDQNDELDKEVKDANAEKENECNENEGSGADEAK